MNSVKLSGRLTADPELKHTADNIPVCTFLLAVDRPTKHRRKGKDDTPQRQEADFPTCVAWRKDAEFVANYLTKGRKIIVEGAVRTRNYDDADGKTRKVTEIQVESIEFADSKPQGGTANE